MYCKTVKLGLALLVIPTNLLASDEVTDYDQYLTDLKYLTISDPKPAIANIASGFGVNQGLFYAAVSYSDFDTQTNVEGDDDGSIAFGFGLGNAGTSVGGEITIGITSVSTSLWGDGKFADEGNVSVKAHKLVAPILGGHAASVSVGATNVAGWGSTTENPVNAYIAFSEQQNFGKYKQFGLAYTLGVGSAVSGNETEPDVFAGIGLGYDDWSVSYSQIGEESHIGATYFIPQLENVALSLSQADAFDRLNSRRMIATLSYSLQLGGAGQ